MKNCPYCHAQLQEHATFCLHCMTALDKKTDTAPKKKRHPWLLVLLVAAAVCILATGIAVGVTAPEEPVLQSSLPAPSTAAPTEPAPTQTEPPETDPPVTLPPETEPPTEPEPTEPAPTLPPEELYTFRKTKTSDYCDPNDMSEWDIVITGVTAQQEVYYIPDSIPTSYGGENRVAGIASDAFKGSGAKVIYTSPYLKFIHYGAFSDCNLTDLYIYSKSVELNPYAYVSLKTLHTLSDACIENFFINTLYFSEITKDVYGAEWAELEKPVSEEAILPAEEVFILRKATAEDFPEEYPHKLQGSALADYVIVGVKIKQETYVIPWQTSSGMHIVGIMPDAFYGSGAKVVYACSRLEYICKDAFRGCALEDFYFAGYSWLTVADGAFDSLETLHSRSVTHLDNLDASMSFQEFATTVLGGRWDEWNPEKDGAPTILFEPGHIY